MPKRKRDGSEASSPDAEAANGNISMRQHRVEQKMDHGLKQLAKAFKTARGFENQKSGRRRKTAEANSDEKEVERIKAEVAALKTLDNATVARNYLYKSLIKFKAVAESPDLPKAVAKPPPPIDSTAKSNVIARLCNSNPVKDALPPIVTEIQRALGVEVKELKKGKKRVRAKDFEKQESTKPETSSNVKKTTESGLDSLAGDGDSDSDSDVPSTTRRLDTAQLGSGSDDDFAQFDARVAGSSDSEDEGAGSEDGEAMQKGKVSRAQALRAAIGDISPSPSQSPSPEPAMPSAKSSKPGSSTFVPSLSMGGYWSGSESEPEDDVDEKPKKNRRGQRARQAIAEKKFGKSAKHLQNQDKAAKQDRNAGWDSKRGATDGPRGREGPRARLGRSGQDRGVRSSAAEPPAKKHRDDSGPLHPSWEAAKKAKEAKKVMAAFEGKKITFD